MARTYRKVVKAGICTGSNTEYYRTRNRKERSKNRQQLRNLIAHHDIETVNDLAITITIPYNDWDEPTDGHYIITKKDADGWLDSNHWNRKIGKYLKPKHTNR